jgi:hypothetical protein
MNSKQRREKKRQQQLLQKETREQRNSLKQTATPAIASISKIVDLLKPWELNPVNKYRTYQSMLLDADVYSAVESRQTAIEAAQSKHKWRYNKNSPRSVFLKEFLDYNVYRMQGSTRGIGKNAAEMIVNGCAPFEVSTSLEALYPDYIGNFVLDKVTYINPLTIDASRPFETKSGGREITFLRQLISAFKDTSGKLLDYSLGKGGVQEIDMRKVHIVAYNSTQGNPFGVSPLDATYTAWREKNLIQEYLLMGIQKDLAGTPVLRVPMQLFDEAKDPSSAAADTLDKLKTHMANLHAGDQTYMILPSDTFNESGQGVQLYDVKFEGIQGTGKNFDLVAILDQKKKTIYNVLGAAHLITGENGGGSYNLVEGKANIQAHYAERDNILVDELWNEHIIPLLLRLNGWNTEKVSDIPVYVHGDVQPVSIDEKGKFFQRVQRALPIVPDVINGLLKTLDIEYTVPQDMPQEELKDLLLLAGLENKAGLGEGSSGTGDSQSGGAASAINSENAA